MRVMISVSLEQRDDICGWKSPNFVQHPVVSHSLAIAVRLRLITRGGVFLTPSYTPFSSESDEGADAGHLYAPVGILLVLEQVSGRGALCTLEARFGTVIDGTDCLGQHDVEQVMFGSTCFRAMVEELLLLPLRNILCWGDEPAIGNDTADTCFIMIPVIGPADIC